ncbi:sulfurtransferase complex subunit TusB [Aestuariirhabdus sp. LZHN29]|uniref:sulfurtransferase complex subunit TusB n=1 Tax=Aestuariirhabdus sp. LZHN29 TaxID=3417462 RepID=UPI003CE9FAAA
MLHIVNKPDSGSDALRRCLNLALPDASLLLIEDGVFNVLPGSSGFQLLCEQPSTLRIYALQEDLRARGLSELLPEQVTPVDYDGFVVLTEQHTKSLSWG